MNAPILSWQIEDGETAAAGLKEQGFSILRGAAPPAQLAAISAELDDRFARISRCDGPFFGRRTKRFQALLSRSRHCESLVLHPLILGIAERVLLPNCDRIQLNLTQAIQIEPGERAQAPHRDQAMWRRTPPGVECMLNVMWPLTEFTAKNGGTRLWPGTNRDPTVGRPPLSEATVAEMQPGDALLYVGSVIHGGGANHSDAPRRGMVISYSLGWLKQAENMSLTYPPAVARRFPRRLTELLGYECQAGNLGSYDGQCPSLLLSGEFDEYRGAREVVAPEHIEILEHFAEAQEWK